VTREDYRTVLEPAVGAALKRHPQVRLYYEVAIDFDGMEAGAAWEDFKVGTDHIARWERIAVVTDVGWMRHAVQAFRFMFPGQIEVFPLAEAARAREWIISI
jgi:hypothetical protein